MVTPETSGSDEKSTGSARWKVPAALLAIVAGTAAVFALTKADPPPVADDALPTTPSTFPSVELPTTTTTTPPFRVADIVSGPQIEWLHRDMLSNKSVVDTIERDGVFHLFVADQSNEGHSGIETWIWDGGWLQVGEKLEGIEHPRVIEAGPGFMAYGTDSDLHPVVWLSTNGYDWSKAALPEPGAATGFWLSGAGVTDEAIILIAEEWQNPPDPVPDAVSARFPGLSGYLGHFDEEQRVVVTAPLGIAVDVLPIEEFGLPEQPEQVPFRTRLVALIGSPDGSSWRRVVLNDDTFGGQEGPVQLIPAITGPDERLLAHGWLSDGSGWVTYASSDGASWDALDVRIPDPFATYSLLTKWHDRFVSMTATFPSGLPVLRTSDDLSTWEDLFKAPTELARCCRWNDHQPDLAVGAAGVATLAQSVDLETYFEGPPSLSRDGFTLEAGHRLTLWDGDRAIIYGDLWQPQRDQVPARLSEDGTTVIIADPRTEQDLTSFTLAELTHLEEAMRSWGIPTYANGRAVLFFSPDGENWTTQDLGDVVSPGAASRIFIGTASLLVISNTEAGTFIWTGIPPTLSDY